MLGRVGIMLAGAAAMLAPAGTAGANGDHDHGPPGDADHSAPADHGDVTQGNFFPVGKHGGRVFGSAKMVRFEQATHLVVQIGGLDSERAYPGHVHEGTCSAPGIPYRHDPDGDTGPPNELWPSSDPDDPAAGVQTDEDGYAHAEAKSQWRARDEAGLVMLHDPKTGNLVACADLT